MEADERTTAELQQTADPPISSLLVVGYIVGPHKLNPLGKMATALLLLRSPLQPPQRNLQLPAGRPA